ncbi:uncharacterized protein LOC121872350, partial [Homarus americanus]|uniref:uncharacterized protein LOC121872350 n=1 Tax=Homarus americanus TaxID=6706 RepID=UPI001C46C9BF
IHLEENFFHNHSTSVRKTTDFVIERISSNVIKNIRTKLIPELRESALEKLKEVIDAATQGSPPCLEWTNDVLQKQVMELCQDMTLQIRKQSSQLALQQSNDEVLTALSLLLPPGISQQGVEVCRKIVCRCSQEKVASWVHSHLTPAVFSKDLTADSDRLLRQAQKAADLQAMALQTSYNDTTISNLELSGTLGTETNFSANQSGPSPLDCLLNSPTNEPRQVYIKAKKVKSTQESVPITVTKHDMDIPSPSTVLSALKELVRTLMNIPKGETPNTISENQIKLMLEEVGKTLTKRQDVTLGVVRAQETLTVDLAVAVAVCVPKLMNSEMQKKFVSLWKPVKDGGVLPNPGSLNSILCSRTVMLVAQNPVVSCQTTAWQKIEELISLLISAELLTPASLLEQCVALLRHTWPQEILSGISSCIEGVSRRALEQKDFHDDPTLLHMLDWVGWVCHQVDDFVDDV